MNKYKFCAVFALLLAVAWSPTRLAAEGKDPEFGDAVFVGYEGAQDWPTSDGGQVLKDFSVPIYMGLPPKKYKVLGRIHDPRTTGFDAVGRAFAEGLFSEKERQRDAADLTKYKAGDAVVVTNDERVLKALKLSKEDVEKTAPLFDHRDSVVLVIKFK